MRCGLSYYRFYSMFLGVLPACLFFLILARYFVVFLKSYIYIFPSSARIPRSRRIIFIIFIKFIIFSINNWYRDVVSRYSRRHRQSGGEVVERKKIENINCSQYIPVKYIINLILFIIIYRSLKIYLANYFVGLDHATAYAVCYLNLDKLIIINK
jgi:quinol-cytochrome oxidoreductase complex cytochrome b subunit